MENINKKLHDLLMSKEGAISIEEAIAESKKKWRKRKISRKPHSL